MRQVSLREFRTRGVKALKQVPRGETVLLSGQQGPVYFLVPVFGDLSLQDQDLRTALAKASLRDSWANAEGTGVNRTSGKEIEAEIKRARAELRQRKVK